MSGTNEEIGSMDEELRERCTKTKPKSRILESVHESARELYRLGFIDKREMQEYDALCLEPAQDYDRRHEAAMAELARQAQELGMGYE